MISLVELLMFVGLTTLTIAWISLGFHRLRASRSAYTTTPRRPDLDAVVGRPAAGAWHSPRRSHRHLIGYEMEYVSPQGSGKGKLVNLTREGWRIEGDRPVTCGTVLSLRAALPAQPIQLDVEQAIVRWVDGAEFGVEILKLRPESACQLDKFLTTRFPSA